MNTPDEPAEKPKKRRRVVPDFPPEQEEAVRRFLQNLIDKRGVSMAEIDERAELGFATTSGILREIRGVTGRVVMRLAQAFGADPYEVLGLAAPPPSPLGSIPGYRDAEVLVRRLLDAEDQQVLIELRSAVFVPQLDFVTPIALAQIAQGVLAARKRSGI